MNEKQKALDKRMDKTTITIIRHGETALNREHRIRGWSDVPIDKEGKKTIEQTGKELIGKLDVIVSSDLTRAQETAHIIHEVTGVPVKEYSTDFRPWDVGTYTGDKNDHIAPIMAEAARHAPNKKIGGGDSFNDVRTRFLDGIERIAKKYKGQRIGVVTHHRGDRIFAGWKAAGMPKDHHVDLDVFLDRDGVEPGKACAPVAIHHEIDK